MSELDIHLRDLAATQTLGQCLARLLQAGDLLLLCGDLGAGKTTLTQFLLATWGIDQVTSPSFTLLHSYRAAFPIHHLDLYRLDREEEVRQLGWDELLDGSSLVIVEWLDKFPGLIPDDVLQIELFYADEGLSGASEDRPEVEPGPFDEADHRSHERHARIRGLGQRSALILEELKRCVDSCH